MGREREREREYTLGKLSHIICVKTNVDSECGNFEITTKKSKK